MKLSSILFFAAATLALAQADPAAPTRNLRAVDGESMWRAAQMEASQVQYRETPKEMEAQYYAVDGEIEDDGDDYDDDDDNDGALVAMEAVDPPLATSVAVSSPSTGKKAKKKCQPGQKCKKAAKKCKKGTKCATLGKQGGSSLTRNKNPMQRNKIGLNRNRISKNRVSKRCRQTATGVKCKKSKKMGMKKNRGRERRVGIKRIKPVAPVEPVADVPVTGAPANFEAQYYAEPARFEAEYYAQESVPAENDYEEDDNDDFEEAVAAMEAEYYAQGGVTAENDSEDDHDDEAEFNF